MVAALREFGMCGICQGVMKSPVMYGFLIILLQLPGIDLTGRRRLECGHAFCKTCLSAQLKHQRRTGTKHKLHFPCGRCRTLIPRAVEPATMYGLQDVLEMLPM